MENNIISIIQPFSKLQKINVYSSGALVASAEVSIEDIPKTIMSYVDEFKIDKVSLFGSKQFNKGIKKRIKEEENKKFNRDELEITLI